LISSPAGESPAPVPGGNLRSPDAIDVEHLTRQREWSRATFGPGRRTGGVIDHIRKELAEIEADPTELGEWVDVIILGFDGAWRAGWEPHQIIAAIKAKQATNETRTWPDWRTRSESVAIEHDKAGR
jgi:dATP/dGTP pyrophosphohydrolase